MGLVFLRLQLLCSIGHCGVLNARRRLFYSSTAAGVTPGIVMVHTSGAFSQWLCASPQMNSVIAMRLRHFKLEGGGIGNQVPKSRYLIDLT